MMTCWSVPLLPLCVGGGILAGGFILISARRRGVEATPLHVLQIFAATTLGVGFAGTAHLMYGAFCPEQLVEVEVYDRDRHRLEPPEVILSRKIDTMHALDILIGGAFLLYLSYRGLKAIYWNPEHL